MTAALAPLPVLLPLLGAALALIARRRPWLQRAISVAATGAVLGVAIILLVMTDRQDHPTTVQIGEWPPGMGIVLVVDRLSALMLTVSATVILAVLVYAIGEGISDSDEATPLSIFHPTYLVLSAGVSNAFLTGDLFNLYVSFEVLLGASYVLLTLGGTGPRVRAGVTYVVVSVLSSTLFLAGIALTYAATGTLNMAELGPRLDALPDGVRAALQLSLLIAFGVKAAVFPLSAWLPESYPSAPAPVTAVFAGLLTKVGMYAILRTQTVLFERSWVDDLLLGAAALTMVVGILGAIAQSDLARMLSFTLISHIGFMLFGAGLAGAAGVAGSVFYIGHHVLVQTTLFLVVGLIERTAATTSLHRLGGLHTSPVLAVLFFLPAVNLAGVPPFSGFVGKVGLIEAGIEDGGAGGWLLVGAAVVTSLLTLYVVGRVWNAAFWRTAEQAAEDPGPPAGGNGSNDEPDAPGTTIAGAPLTEVAEPLPRMCVAATGTLVMLGVALVVLAGPLYGLSDRAADSLIENGAGGRGETTMAVRR